MLGNKISSSQSLPGMTLRFPVRKAKDDRAAMYWAVSLHPRKEELSEVFLLACGERQAVSNKRQKSSFNLTMDLGT